MKLQPRGIRFALASVVIAGLVATAVVIAVNQPNRSDAASVRSPLSVSAANGYSVVVNKQRPLPRGFVPRDLVTVDVPFAGQKPRLRAKAAHAVEALFAAFARETGLRMQSNSAYRSYAEQRAEYIRFTRALGASEAGETTAEPGYSEHETGLAIDVGAPNSGCDARACFADTSQAKWLAANAWRFGFIIRYPR